MLWYHVIKHMISSTIGQGRQPNCLMPTYSDIDFNL